MDSSPPGNLTPNPPWPGETGPNPRSGGPWQQRSSSSADPPSLRSIVLQLQSTVSSLEAKVSKQQTEMKEQREEIEMLRGGLVPAKPSSTDETKTVVHAPTQGGDGEQQQQQQQEQDLEIATTWRVIIWMGVSISSGLAFAASLAKDPESALWAALMFWPSSWMCNWSLVTIYAGIVGTRRGKCALGLAGILVGLPLFLTGPALMADEDDDTSDIMKDIARIFLVSGAIVMVVFPFENYQNAKKWSELPQQEYNKGLLDLMKSLPKAAGSLSQRPMWPGWAWGPWTRSCRASLPLKCGEWRRSGRRGPGKC